MFQGITIHNAREAIGWTRPNESRDRRSIELLIDIGASRGSDAGETIHRHV
jgi:hypothetical protein